MWYFIIIIDYIIKLFQYAWFIIIPIIIFIIFLLIKKKKLDKNNFKEVKKISIIIKCLILFIIIGLFTIRVWGPNFYKVIISFSICNKEKYIEKKLEYKYGRNFNYISQDKIVVKKDSGYVLLQDINGDYSVRYIFKDDDGVTAIVKYTKNYQSDYYESKRSKYEIEKKIYDYAKKVNFNKKFYVYVESDGELTSNSNLNIEARNNIISKYTHKRIKFILTEESNENKTFIVSALKNIFDKKTLYIDEHIVTEEEYERAVNFYNSLFQQTGIAEFDYYENFDFNNQINYKHYYIN